MAKKILVIDDDLFIREIYVDVLKQAGYDVDSADDGEEGLNHLKNGGYDLVLLDYLMPKMNGLDVLNALSTNPPTIPNGPIILLTNSTPESNDPDSIIQNCMKKGASSHFVKTELTPEDLIINVKKILGDS